MLLWTKGGETLFYHFLRSKRVSYCVRATKEGYWCYVMDIQEKEETVSNVPIVCEFKDAFLKELPGLPPQRKIDFEIKFIPGFQPISKAPYRMAPTEFKELKIQLVDLLQKGFI